MNGRQESTCPIFISYYNNYIQFNLSFGGKKMQLREKILKLEQTLMYYRKKDFEDLLAEDFGEFGSSGKIYDKEIQLSPVTEHGCDEIQFNIVGFEVIELTDCLVQTRYKTEHKQTGKKSLRSSLWRLENNQWRLFFHQGTLTT